MEVQFILNGKKTSADVADGTMLLDLLREKGCYSVKCGCETTNCVRCGSMVFQVCPAQFWQRE